MSFRLTSWSELVYAGKKENFFCVLQFKLQGQVIVKREKYMTIELKCFTEKPTIHWDWDSCTEPLTAAQAHEKMDELGTQSVEKAEACVSPILGKTNVRLVSKRCMMF